MSQARLQRVMGRAGEARFSSPDPPFGGRSGLGRAACSVQTLPNSQTQSYCEGASSQESWPTPASHIPLFFPPHPLSFHLPLSQSWPSPASHTSLLLLSPSISLYLRAGLAQPHTFPYSSLLLHLPLSQSWPSPASHTSLLLSPSISLYLRAGLAQPYTFPYSSLLLHLPPILMFSYPATQYDTAWLFTCTCTCLPGNHYSVHMLCKMNT